MSDVNGRNLEEPSLTFPTWLAYISSVLSMMACEETKQAPRPIQTSEGFHVKSQ